MKKIQSHRGLLLDPNKVAHYAVPMDSRGKFTIRHGLLPRRDVTGTFVAGETHHSPSDMDFSKRRRRRSKSRRKRGILDLFMPKKKR